MFEHEEVPPVGTWERIAKELDTSENVVYMQGSRKNSKSRFSRLAAAASIAVLVIAAIFIFNRNNNSGHSTDTQTLSGQPNSMTSSTSPEKEKRYITVTTPEGKKVKVSSKFSGAIGSLYQGPEEDPKWTKKFTEWREIMQNKALAPTTTNFLDIMEMTDFLEQAN